MSGERIRAALAELREAVTAAGIERVAIALQSGEDAQTFCRAVGSSYGNVTPVKGTFNELQSVEGVAVLARSTAERPFQDAWKS